MDLYATDRVVEGNEGGARRMDGIGKSIATQTVTAIAGLNATGKTTVLRAIALAQAIVNGAPLGNRFMTDRPLAQLVDPDYGLRFTAVFKTECGDQDAWWLLESCIIPGVGELEAEEVPAGGGPLQWRFEKETLWRHRNRQISKKELSDFDNFKKSCDREMDRSPEATGGVTDNMLRFLQPDVSIVSGMGFRRQQTLVMFEGMGRRFPIPVVSTKVIHAFDDSVEALSLDDDGLAHLKFVTDEAERVLSQFEAGRILSVGTLRGSEIVKRAIAVLRSGGMLLIDEMENSLNKKLVEAIIDLFVGIRTNPNGALLVFTTHYPELLNHLSRIDDIYLTQRTDAREGVKLSKYSDLEGRPELSRADVFLSNRLGGTAPKADDIRELFDYVHAMTTVDGAVDRV